MSVQCRKLPSLIIGCIYRHPKAPNITFEYLLDVFRAVSLRNKPVFIFGDLNDNLLSPNNKLDQIIKISKLNQIIDKPTRITSHSETLLDVVITNKPDMILKHDVSPCEIADHERISISIDLTKPKRKTEIRTYRSLKNYDQNTFCNLILDQLPTLNLILETDNVDKQVETFNKVFRNSLDECAPIVTKEIRRPFAPWITEDIRSSMKQRDETRRILKGDRNNSIAKSI